MRPQDIERVLPQNDDRGLRVKALVDSIRNPAQPMVPQHIHAPHQVSSPLFRAYAG